MHDNLLVWIFLVLEGDDKVENECRSQTKPRTRKMPKVHRRKYVFSTASVIDD
jgi:hypothetical protein